MTMKSYFHEVVDQQMEQFYSENREQIRESINKLIDSKWDLTSKIGPDYYSLFELIQDIFNILSIKSNSYAYWKSPITLAFLAHKKIGANFKAYIPDELLFSYFSEVYPDLETRLPVFIEKLSKELSKLRETDENVIVTSRLEGLLKVLKGEVTHLMAPASSQHQFSYTEKGALSAFYSEEYRQEWKGEAIDQSFSPSAFINVQQAIIQELGSEKSEKGYQIRRDMVKVAQNYIDSDQKDKKTYRDFLVFVEVSNQDLLPHFESDFARLYWLDKVLERPFTYANVDAQKDKFVYEEHELIGAKVKILKYHGDEEAMRDIRGGMQLSLLTATPEKIELTAIEPEEKLNYGSVVGLGGDFYGSRVISDGENPGDLRERFVEAINTLMKPGAQVERDRIAEISQSGFSTVREQYELTKLLGWRYMNLLSNNYDHFAPDAYKAYLAGHSVALELAEKAYELNQAAEYQLSELYIDAAYLCNAFACHFLSDHFAGGHLRVPRRQLVDKFGAILGGLLSNRMHNEDGDHGVVASNNDSTWKLYGDGKFYKFLNIPNVQILHFAMQASADEIKGTYESGQQPEVDEVLKYIPKVVFPESNPEQSYPMFRPNEQGSDLEMRANLGSTREARQCSEFVPLTKEALKENIRFFGSDDIDKLIRLSLHVAPERNADNEEIEMVEIQENFDYQPIIGFRAYH